MILSFLGWDSSFRPFLSPTTNDQVEANVDEVHLESEGSILRSFTMNKIVLK